MIKRAQRRPYRARFEPGPGATVTKINSGASFQLITEFNTPENYQPYGMYLVYIREAVHCRGHRTLAFYLDNVHCSDHVLSKTCDFKFPNSYQVKYLYMYM